MGKVWRIGWKDVVLSFRDRAALILMLLAPFALTLGLGAVTGRLSGGDGSAISHIPVVVVNQDTGAVGQALVAMFQSQEMRGLVEPTVAVDPQAARQQVDEDGAAAAILVPAGFSDSIAAAAGAAEQIVLYTNPTQPTSAGVVKAIVDGFVSRVEVGRVAGQVTATQLVGQGLIGPDDAGRVAAELAAGQAKAGLDIQAIQVTDQAGEAASVQFDPLAYMAPGMALMFLMFTTMHGGRTLLAERAQGTLPRLLVSPTTSIQILGGKVLGIYLTGVAQVAILILASTLLFRLNWGDPLAVAVLVLAAVAGAVGWGMIITALAKTPGQVGSVGSALMLIFGVLGGSFFNLEYMPSWFRTVSKISPNAWGMEGFTTLALGGRLSQIWGPVLALLAMGALLFTIAAVLIRRRGIAQG